MKLPTKIPFDSTMYSSGISSLYASIPTETGIELISYCLHRKQELIPQQFTNDFIIESLKFISKMSNFFLMTTCTFN